MDKVTAYLKYYEAIHPINELHKNAHPLKDSIPRVKTYQDGDKIFIGKTRTDKDNTMTSTREILDVLQGVDLEGKLVTITGFNLTFDVSKEIISRGGHYVCALKGKYQNLYIDASEYFREIISAREEEFRYDSVIKEEKPEDIEVDTKICYTSTDVSWLHYRRDWTDIRSVSMILRQDQRDGKIVHKASYFVSNLEDATEHYKYAHKSHWGDEDMLWWVQIQPK